MDSKLHEISNQQKESWNKFSPGWKKWDAKTMEMLKPTGDEIIRLLKPEGAQTILDVAAGTGEPGLTIASMLSSGKVISTDISEGMLAVAREHAFTRKIKNFEAVTCDVSEMPFDDERFDAISCRMGFMFFPDMKLALKEMIRVLKPGGKLSTAVWAEPEQNFWATSVMGVIKKYIPMDPPPPEAPGLFRCAEPGMMANLMKDAGMKNVSEKTINGEVKTDSPEQYWEMMTEVAAPIVAALSKADASTFQKIKDETIELIRTKNPAGPVCMTSKAFVIYGEKA